MRYAWDSDQLEAALFVCGCGDHDRDIVVQEIDSRHTTLAEYGQEAFKRSSLLCHTVRVEGRIPNKDIVGLEIYPPLPDDITDRLL